MIPLLANLKSLTRRTYSNHEAQSISGRTTNRITITQLGHNAVTGEVFLGPVPDAEIGIARCSIRKEQFHSLPVGLRKYIKDLPKICTNTVRKLR